jgi:hypothetical protein
VSRFEIEREKGGSSPLREGKAGIILLRHARNDALPNLGAVLPRRAQKCLADGENPKMMSQKDDSMDIEPTHYRSVPPIPPSYDQCVATVADPKADYVISPLAMAALFAWDEDDE